MKFNQTFSILFWLFRKKQNKRGLVPIYARITIDGARAECSVKRRIAPGFWDAQKGQASEAYLEAPVLNEYLAMVRAEIGKHYNILLSTQDHVTARQVKNSYLGDKTKKKAKKTFLQIFKLYLKMLEEKVKIEDISTGRYKRLCILYGKCESFIKHTFKVPDVLPGEMKLNFIVGFEHYLRTVQCIGHNTAMKYAKDLKQVMTYAAIEEDILYNPFQSFKCTYKKVKPKYLDQDELTILETKELSIQRLDEVRDCFIFSCYTGYAYSDVAALTPEDIGKGIDGNMWILRDRKKTENAENVPLLPVALKLIEKYRNHPYCKASGKLLPVNSNQRYNAYLKEIADICGIKKKLTTHVARHTCATTVLLTNDVPLETTMEFLGHASIRTTQIYAKVVQKKLSKDLSQLRDKIQNA